MLQEKNLGVLKYFWAFKSQTIAYYIMLMESVTHDYDVLP